MRAIRPNIARVCGGEDGTALGMLGRLGVSPETLQERLFELRGRALPDSMPRQAAAGKRSP